MKFNRPPQRRWPAVDKVRDLLYDPRCWAVGVFLIGLVTLDLPLHDDHSWRQGWGMMIARNFYTVDFNIFYPLSDICGERSPDYFATELPLMQALMAAGYHVFGEQWWIGRLINWSVSCLGLWYFSRLVGELVSPRAGLYAMIALIGSIVLTFSRKVMPDTFSLFLVVIGTYYLYRYLWRGRRWQLVLGGVLVALGVLCKIPSVVVVTLLAVPYLRGELPIERKVLTAAALGLAAALMVGWYFYWMPHLQEMTTCFPLIYPVSLREGFDIVVNELSTQALMRVQWNAFYSEAPYYLSVLGFFLTVLRLQWRLVLAGLIYSLIFLLFVFKTGAIFPSHSYYVIPYVPLMALFIGALLDRSTWLPRRVSLVASIALCVVPLSVTLMDVRLVNDLKEVRLAPVLDSLGVAQDAKVMINGRWGEPTTMYYSGRRGWVLDNNHLTNYQWMPDYRSKGLQYIIQDQRKLSDTLGYRQLYRDDTWVIYDVGSVGDPLPTSTTPGG